MDILSLKDSRWREKRGTAEKIIVEMQDHFDFDFSIGHP